MADALIHGIRATYQHGCRCLPCRAANAEYVRTHVPTDWTTAEKSQAHLKAIASTVGVKQAAKLSGLSKAHLQRIRNGQQITVKLSTEAVILAIQPIPAPGQRINGYRTRDRIRSLVKEGYTRSRLAFWLGYRRPEVDLRRRTVTAKNAQRVQRLYEQLTAEA